MKFRLAALLLTLLIAIPCLAATSLNYVAIPSFYETAPGGIVDLGAALQNTGTATVYVNDLSLTFNGPAASYFTVNPFFNFFDNVPGTFETTDSAFSGSISEIVIDPSTPPGTYTITANLIGGASPSLTDPVNDVIGSQTFTIVVGTQSGNTSLPGGFAQIASGAGWNTTMTLVNPSARAVSGQITFYGDAGGGLPLPLTFPELGLTLTESSQKFSLGPEQSLVIETTGTSQLSVGWAEVESDSALAGYSIFQFAVPGGAESEGTASFDTSQTSSIMLPYDDTNGYRTGVAIANELATAQTVTVALYDQNGASLTAFPINLPAFGHTSFFLADLFPAAQNGLGVVQFSGGMITAIGLRFSPSGTFTSIPPIP